MAASPANPITTSMREKSGRFLFLHPRQFGDDPESAVIHPGKKSLSRSRSPGRGRRDETRVPLGLLKPCMTPMVVTMHTVAEP